MITGVLPSKEFGIREAIVRIAKTNTILKRPVNKLFPTENIKTLTKARQQKLRRETAVLGELKINYECQLREY